MDQVYLILHAELGNERSDARATSSPPRGETVFSDESPKPVAHNSSRTRLDHRAATDSKRCRMLTADSENRMVKHVSILEGWTQGKMVSGIRSQRPASSEPDALQQVAQLCDGTK